VDSKAPAKQLLREQLRRDRELRYMAESWLHVISAPEIKAADVIATYLSYGVEPQTVDINEALLKSGKTVLAPRMRKNKELDWIIWDGKESSLRKHGKIYEPVGDVFADLSKISAVIVPALAIDRLGNRMGQGGGSYDRALDEMVSNHGAGKVPWKVGLVGALEFTQDVLPTESHDQPLDAAATPTLLVRFTR